jgi:hypothetical protein
MTPSFPRIRVSEHSGAIRLRELQHEARPGHKAARYTTQWRRGQGTNPFRARHTSSATTSCHGWPEDAGGLSAVSHVRSEAAP